MVRFCSRFFLRVLDRVARMTQFFVMVFFFVIVHAVSDKCTKEY